jgi:hypothetical protein
MPSESMGELLRRDTAGAHEYSLKSIKTSSVYKSEYISERRGY